MRRFWRKKDFKTFCVLLGAFATVGFATSLTLYVLMSERVWHDARSELLTTARLISLQVDGDQHKKLVRQEQMTSKTYLDENLKLAKAQAVTPDIRYVYTMRKVDGKVYFVLDPTEAGDSDGDGVDDQSKLMELYEDHDPYLDRAMDTGAPAVADEIYSDKWGDFLTSYAPIFDSEGRVVAMLGVDLEAKKLVGSLWDIRLRAILGFVLSIVAGGILAAFLSRRKRSDGAHVDSSLLVRAFQRHGSVRIQLLILGILAGTMVTGTMGYFMLRNDGRSQAELDVKEKDLHAIRSHLERAAFAEKLTESSVEGIGNESAFKSFPSINTIKREFLEEVKSGDPRAKRTLSELMEAAQGAQVSIQHKRESLVQQNAGAQTQSVAMLFLSIALSMGAFALVRFAHNQQVQLIEADDATTKAQLGYRNVVESIPIGFFKFKQGELSFSNQAFDQQTQRQPGQTATESLALALEASNQSSVLESLVAFEHNQAPFEFYFSLFDSSKSVRYFESRGVPVFDLEGNYEHLVCFNLDITDIVEATTALQLRSDEIEASNARLQLTLTELETNFSAMVMAFVKAIEAKDPYTAGHSERVMLYSVAIAERAGLDSNEIELLRKAALVHDVGKIGIPDGILTKPDKLTDEEFGIIKRHASLGAEMIRAIPLFSDCVPVVRWHHERLDGSGYPDGLVDKEIPVIVRIAAVADSFDAMTSTRAYRRGMSADGAIGELRKDVEKGRLDGKFVELLADIIKEQGVIGHEDAAMAA